MRTLIACAALWLFACEASSALPGDWPRATSQESNPDCTRPIELAKHIFQSREFFLYAPPERPHEWEGELVLSRAALDISDRIPLNVSRDYFAEFDGENPAATGRLYWQAHPPGAFRVAVRQIPFGWRGDRYSAYVLPIEVSSDQVFSWTSSSEPLPIIFESWHPPLVLRNGATGALFIIDVGGSFLDDWPVYAATDRGSEPICTLRFAPRVSDPSELLPLPVRHLARSLDGTLGDGHNEGSLRPTDRQRTIMAYTWANIAMRPWAVHDRAYNSRAQVDRALARWARTAPRFQELHDAIQSQYEPALISLTAYYVQEFGLEADQAHRQASYALDIAYRTPFIFRGAAHRTPTTANPWPN